MADRERTNDSKPTTSEQPKAPAAQSGGELKESELEQVAGGVMVPD